MKRIAAEHFGPAAEVRVFGSRARPEARGGDLDLHVLVPGKAPDWQLEARAGARLESALDDLHVDLLVRGTEDARRRIDEVAPGDRSAAVNDEDTRRAVRLASHPGGRLGASLASLAPFLPFDAAQVVAANETLPDATDAFLKRFETLVNHLQDQAWRLIAVEEGFRDPSEMSRRDIAEFMAKLELLTSYEDFREVLRVRNRLSHVYPDDPARQARRLAACIDASALLLDCVARIEAWAARRLSPPASP